MDGANTICVGASGRQTVEDLLEGRHNPYQQCSGDGECQQQDRDEIGERCLDLGALRSRSSAQRASAAEKLNTLVISRAWGRGAGPRAVSATINSFSR